MSSSKSTTKCEFHGIVVLMSHLAKTFRHEMLGTNGGKDSVCVRKFLKDHMECVCTVDDIITTRTYKRLDK